MVSLLPCPLPSPNPLGIYLMEPINLAASPQNYKLLVGRLCLLPLYLQFDYKAGLLHAPALTRFCRPPSCHWLVFLFLAGTHFS